MCDGRIPVEAEKRKELESLLEAPKEAAEACANSVQMN
jgi:hypothetical protein